MRQGKPRRRRISVGRAAWRLLPALTILWGATASAQDVVEGTLEDSGEAIPCDVYRTIGATLALPSHGSFVSSDASLGAPSVPARCHEIDMGSAARSYGDPALADGATTPASGDYSITDEADELEYSVEGVSDGASITRLRRRLRIARALPTRLTLDLAYRRHRRASGLTLIHDGARDRDDSGLIERDLNIYLVATWDVRRPR